MSAQPRLGVLIGGPSREHDVSRASADYALSVLDPNRYTITPILVTADSMWQLHSSTQDYQSGRPTIEFPHAEAVGRLPYLIDAALIMMHGEFGEDGQLQRILDQATIPYQGSGVRASRLAFDKHRSMQVFKRLGLAVPDYTIVNRAQWVSARARLIRQIIAAYGFPVVVKPNAAGSSIGVKICFSAAQLAEALESASVEYDQLIVQRFVQGVELTCGVLEDEQGAFALPPTMIRPREAKFFDYLAKYTPDATEEITPAPLSESVSAAVQRAALAAHRALGCRDYSRTDFILGRNRLWVLETNTLPGLTGVSLLPQAAAAIGYDYAALIEHLAQRAFSRPEVVELHTYESGHYE
ncbi:MAG: D-alanine--D-alanine ligase [Candidatus Saccharibacteria bacterium]|jgi:D-alanine-D-alanine ligase